MKNPSHSTSPFVDDAISKSAIASQIILYNKKDSKLAIADMVNQQLKLAEYYLHNMNLPDSALSVYRGIEKHRYEIKSELDSLQLKLSIMESDTIEVDTLHTVVSDSLLNESAKTDTSTVVKTQVPTNETKQVSSNQDSHQQKHEQHGSQKKESAIPVKTEGRDSTNTQVKSDSLNIPVHKAEPTHKELKARERQLLADLMEYDTEYAPLALFDQIWIYKYSLPDSMNMMAVYQHMQNEYPLNQYTHAAGMLIQGKEVVVTTDQEIENEEQYKQAMSIYSTSPDSAKTILKSLTELKGSPFGDKAKYSLGYIYWFNEHDSTDAKPYFDDLLKKDINSDYSKFIIQFYTGKNFVFTDLIPSFKALEEKEKRDRAEKILKEKMLKELNQPVTNPQPRDSLKTYSLPVKHDNPDTLKREVPTVEDQVKQDLLNKEQEIVKDVVNLPQPFDQYRPYDLYKPFIIKTQ